MLENKDSSIEGFHLCYYVPSKNDTTALSNLIIDFKNNKCLDIIDEVCKWACSELEKSAITVTLIVRALRSVEIEAMKKESLDILGFKLSETLKTQYRPQILKKTKYTFPLKKVDINKRNKEIENVYFTNYTFYDDDVILIIDDIFTSGATINEIVRCIKKSNSKVKIYCFTIAKTDFQADINEEIMLPGFLYK